MNKATSILKKSNTGLLNAKISVLRSLIYFDIFSYPLRKEELIKFHSQTITDHDLFEVIIQELLQEEWIFSDRGFYSIHQDFSIIDKRLAGNNLAVQKIPKAKLFGSIIAKFPFVRAVLISGSLSKNYMDKNSDVDFFIITQPGRLWLTRAMLALFKRVFLFNSRKYFCTNYLIDSASLEIEEKNFFTAIELVTLIPVYGSQLANEFRDKNKWVTDFFPNSTGFEISGKATSQSIIKTLLEKFLNLSIFNSIDSALMQLTIGRWKKKFGSQLSDADFKIALKSRKGVSKSHPQFMQKRILDTFQQRLKFFEGKFQMSLNN